MRQSKVLVRAMDYLIAKVRFENANFDMLNDELKITAFIKEKTKLYTESWVIPVLIAIKNGDSEFLNKFL